MAKSNNWFVFVFGPCMTFLTKTNITLLACGLIVMRIELMLWTRSCFSCSKATFMARLTIFLDVDQLRCSGELYTVIYTYEGNHGIHRSSWT